MSRVTWKKLWRFLISVFASVALLAILSDFFLIGIQTFIVENMQGMDIKLPNAASPQDRNLSDYMQYVRDTWEQEGWPEKRTVVIDLEEKTATFDFSFVINKDHPLADGILYGGASYGPRAFAETVFGQWQVMGVNLEDTDFQAPSINIDTKTNTITVHFLAVRPIDDYTSISLLPETGQNPVVPVNEEVIVNYKGRKLLAMYPYPSESLEGIIKINSETSDFQSGMQIETEVAQTAMATFSQFLSRQLLLQKVGGLLNIPFIASLLSAFLSALPLLLFLAILWTWKQELPTSLLLLSEVVLALLSFHFAFYLVGAIGNLYYSIYDRLSAAGFQEGINTFYTSLYSNFDLYPYVNYTPLGFLSVGIAMMSVLIPILLIRRSRQWEEVGKGNVHLTDPFQPENRPAAERKRPSIWSIFTYCLVVLLIAFPLVYAFYFSYANDFLDTSHRENIRHLLLVCFQVGIFGVALMLLFRGLYHRIDGKPIPSAAVPLAFWVIFIGNLIWSLTYGLQINAQRDISAQTGWGWLVYATVLGAVLVYAIMRLVYALARQAGLVSGMDRRIQALLIVLAILSAIPMRLLYSSSATPADYYEVLNLAEQLDNLIKFIFLAGLTWFFYEEGNQSPEIKPLSPLVLSIGLLAGATIFYPSSSHWLFVPLTFILGYRALSNYIRPAEYWKELAPLFPRVFNERINFLEEIVNINTGERAYQQLQKTLSTKMSEDNLPYSEFKKQMDARRKELDDSNEKAMVSSKPIKDVALTFGPKLTAWENGVHGALWAALFSIPWISIWMYNFMTGEATTSAYPLWAFFADLLNLLVSWLGIGFLFGYFYPFLRGKNGLQKGIWLWLVIVVPALPLALINNSSPTDWQGFLFWVIQVFIHCMLLGLFAFDYMTLRQGYRDWQMLFELHGIPFVGVSISTILIAAGTAITTLFQEQTQEIVKTALTFILPNADKLINH